MHSFDIDLDIDLWLAWAIRLPVNQASYFDPQFSLDPGFLNSVLIQRGIIDQVQGLIDHSAGTFSPGLLDTGSAFGITTQHVGERGAVDGESVGAIQRAGHPSDSIA